MLRTTARIAKIAIYGLIILIGVTFAVSNRAKVEFTFYPMPYAVGMPLFLFAILVFALGLFLGWMLGKLKAGEYRRAHKRASKRTAALENELGTLRAERSLGQSAPLPLK